MKALLAPALALALAASAMAQSFVVPAGTGSSSSSQGNGIPTLGTVTVFAFTNLLVDASGGNLFRKTLTNSFNAVFTNGTDGQVITLELEQDSAGNRNAWALANTGGSATNNIRYSDELTTTYLKTNAAAVSRWHFFFRASDKTWRLQGVSTGY